MSLLLKGILYPGIQMFTVAEGKQQSAQIVKDKIDEICKLIPAMSKEILWDTRGRIETTRQTKDSVVYSFRNGSKLENIVAGEKTRGRRFHAGNMEEAATLDQDMLQQVVIPTLNVPRTVNGKVDPNEVVNQSQCYVTSAGYKNTFAYDKLIETLCQSVATPKKAFILGGDFRVPVRFGAFQKTFLRDLKADGTFNEATFDREYNSHWTGNVESAFFDSQVFDRHRINKLPELTPNGRNNSKAYYILGVDVGRFGCTTEVCVIKVSPALSGVPQKHLVNMYSYEAEHFGLQALHIKKIFAQYKCRAAVIDANGVGAGLVDFLVTDQIDPDTGETWYNLGVMNDEPDKDGKMKYRKFQTSDTIHNAMYLMKATAPLNSEMYSYCQTQMQHGKLKFLVDENVAKTDRMSQTKWKKKKPEERELELKPYVMTTALREEMANMIEESEGANIILKPANKKIKHDRFSAFIYGLYYCKLEEDKGHRRRSRNLSDFMMYSKSKM